MPHPPILDVNRHLVPAPSASLLFSRPEYGVERLSGLDMLVGERLFRLSPAFFDAAPLCGSDRGGQRAAVIVQPDRHG